MQDPIQVLRTAIKTGAEIELLSPSSTKVYTLPEASSLQFPTTAEPIVLAKTTPTRLPNEAAGKDAVFDLQSILFCYLKRDSGYADYLSEAQKLGVAFVNLQMRATLVDYLLSKTNKLDAIVQPPTTDTTSSQSPAKKARYVPNKQDQEAVRQILACHEAVQIADRTTVLHGVKPNDFSAVKDLIHDRLKQGKEALKLASGSANAPRPMDSSASNKRKNRNPIIMISPSSTAIITMHNVKKFLEDGIFETSEAARASGSRLADDVVVINHRRPVGLGPAGNVLAANSQSNEKVIRYFVIDGHDALTKFGEDAWDRVVCVMTTGQEWQFRAYKWTEPKELFHHVKGIHPKFSNEPTNPLIKSWNVNELKIDPSKRHLDKSVVSSFWREIESWISHRKNGIVDF